MTTLAPSEKPTPAEVLRQGTASQLREALCDVRCRTHALFDGWEAALPTGMPVPYAPGLNPPRWEFAHVAWFEERWLQRQPQWRMGTDADPGLLGPRGSILPGADAMLDSAKVAHRARWHLPLPPAAGCRSYAQAVREQSLQSLDALEAAGQEDDRHLYFFRLALAHECMHAEALAYMAKGLGLSIQAATSSHHPAAPALRSASLHIDACRLTLGQGQAAGFAFDNECGELPVALEAFEIDAAAVSGGDFEAFIADGGYRQRAHWSEAGWAWKEAHTVEAPLHWDSRHTALPACAQAAVAHVSLHEAQAWCHWAGRRLPSEAEWVCAQRKGGERFVWGEVWEWTASPFAPFVGFRPHPYREYSAPWFDGRPVLKGAGPFTLPWMRHPGYRNYFEGDRRDIAAGFRTCAR
jgi:gamma-glutamyl hercynylcysteine S-oxide synthase